MSQKSSTPKATSSRGSSTDLTPRCPVGPGSGSKPPTQSEFTPQQKIQWVKLMQWRAHKSGLPRKDFVILRALLLAFLEGKESNVASVSAFTGLPRTTVHRRLAILEKQGRLHQKPLLILDPDEFERLCKFAVEIMKRAAKILCVQNGHK